VKDKLSKWVEEKISNAPQTDGLIFASASFDSWTGGTFRLADGKIIGKARDVSPALEFFPELCVAWLGTISKGAGLILKRGKESFWIPHATVRGHPPATNSDLAPLPEWARKLHNWYLDR